MLHIGLDTQCMPPRWVNRTTESQARGAWGVLPITMTGIASSPYAPAVAANSVEGMGATLPILAGMVSAAVFAGSMLPMLRTAGRTCELSSGGDRSLAARRVAPVAAVARGAER